MDLKTGKLFDPNYYKNQYQIESDKNSIPAPEKTTWF